MEQLSTSFVVVIIIIIIIVVVVVVIVVVVSDRNCIRWGRSLNLPFG